jgi:hypothetical protein
MQVSIARQLGLQPTTVGNFFMNARRRLHDKWDDEEDMDDLEDDPHGHAHGALRQSETSSPHSTASADDQAQQHQLSYSQMDLDQLSDAGAQLQQLHHVHHPQHLQHLQELEAVETVIGAEAVANDGLGQQHYSLTSL